MKKESLDLHDKRPENMINYLSYYGWHFNKKMCDWAISLIEHKGVSTKSINKEKVEQLLDTYSIKIDNDILYDKVYVAAMLKADLLGKGIPDEQNLAKAIKSYLDDEDGYDTVAFSRFYIDTIKKGIPIDWDSML